MTAEQRDSVRVEQVMVAVHDTIMETVTIVVRENEQGDTLRLSKVTERDRVRDRTGFKVQDSRVTVKRDTVYVEKRDSVLVKTNTDLTNRTEKGSAIVASLKWVFWIIIALIALVITIKLSRIIRI